MKVSWAPGSQLFQGIPQPAHASACLKIGSLQPAQTSATLNLHIIMHQKITHDCSLILSLLRHQMKVILSLQTRE